MWQSPPALLLLRALRSRGPKWRKHQGYWLDYSRADSCFRSLISSSTRLLPAETGPSYASLSYDGVRLSSRVRRQSCSRTVYFVSLCVAGLIQSGQNRRHIFQGYPQTAVDSGEPRCDRQCHWMVGGHDFRWPRSVYRQLGDRRFSVFSFTNYVFFPIYIKNWSIPFARKLTVSLHIFKLSASCARRPVTSSLPLRCEIDPCIDGATNSR